MIISRFKLKNWRNFREVDVKLSERVFLVGPNASGKSNFLDAIRFLRDIAKTEGGGLKAAIANRGGISKIRCLSAKRDPKIQLEIELSEKKSQKPTWRYSLSIKQETRGHREFQVESEEVWKDDKKILNRPDPDDKADNKRLTQTHLEQVNSNSEFRDIVTYLSSVLYFHLVPQLIRHPEVITGPSKKDDPFGRTFLEKIAQTSEKTRKARLRKIQNALSYTVPQLKQLNDIKDKIGIPHLEAIYEHWRAKGAKQTEEEFSDGTLRLIGLLWSILESDSVLLLEEPELSLHSAIVKILPGLIWRLQNKKKRQILLSTHSCELLNDQGIGGEEVLMLKPDKEGTIVEVASLVDDVRALLSTGLTVGQVVPSRTQPKDIHQLSLFNE